MAWVTSARLLSAGARIAIPKIVNDWFVRGRFEALRWPHHRTAIDLNSSDGRSVPTTWLDATADKRIGSDIRRSDTDQREFWLHRGSGRFVFGTFGRREFLVTALLQAMYHQIVPLQGSR